MPVSSNVRPHMPVTSARKLLVAVQLLERAVELHLRGDSFYASIHLSAAAEEILNVYARQVTLDDGSQFKPSFDEAKDAMVTTLNPQTDLQRQAAEKWAYDRLTRAKNIVKHMRGPKDTQVNMDAEVESDDCLDRAISTYFRIQPIAGLPLIYLIQAFDRARQGSRL